MTSRPVVINTVHLFISFISETKVYVSERGLQPTERAITWGGWLVLGGFEPPVRTLWSYPPDHRRSNDQHDSISNWKLLVRFPPSPVNIFPWQPLVSYEYLFESRFFVSLIQKIKSTKMCSYFFCSRLSTRSLCLVIFIWIRTVRHWLHSLSLIGWVHSRS